MQMGQKICQYICFQRAKKNSKKTHRAHNLECLNISRNRRRRNQISESNLRHYKSERSNWKMNALPKLQGILPRFVWFGSFECITGLFQSILCVRYLASSPITVSLFRFSAFCFWYPFFFCISVPFATYCAQAHQWLFIFIDRVGCSF